MTESYYDQLSRVRLMADDDSGTWDLSLKDVAAIRTVLAKLDRLRDLLIKVDLAVHLAASDADLRQRISGLLQDILNALEPSA